MFTTIAFGRFGDWASLVNQTIDKSRYIFDCVQFDDFDLNKIDYAVPITLRDAEILRLRHDENRTKYIIPNRDVVLFCNDKKEFNERILNSPFAPMIPPIYVEPERHYPYVLKKRDDLSGNEIFVIRDAADESRHIARLDADGYFCQAFVPGAIEYATHMLMVDNDLVYHSTNKYEMSDHYSIKGTCNRPKAEFINIEMNPIVIITFTTLLRAIGFNGTCCVDYKIMNGRIQLMEINPRCGFSLFRDINRYLSAYTNALM